MLVTGLVRSGKMKLILENWKKFLNEAAQTLETLPENYYIKIITNSNDDFVGKNKNFKWQSNTAYGIRLTDEENNKLGSVNVDKEKFLGSDVYTMHFEVDESLKRKGYGPLLTDIALELAANDGMYIVPASLVGHMDSKDSRNLYKFYLNNRKDVVHKPIDMDKYVIESIKKRNTDYFMDYEIKDYFNNKCLKEALDYYSYSEDEYIDLYNNDPNNIDIEYIEEDVSECLNEKLSDLFYDPDEEIIEELVVELNLSDLVRTEYKRSDSEQLLYYYSKPVAILKSPMAKQKIKMVGK